MPTPETSSQAMRMGPEASPLLHSLSRLSMGGGTKSQGLASGTTGPGTWSGVQIAKQCSPLGPASSLDLAPHTAEPCVALSAYSPVLPGARCPPRLWIGPDLASLRGLPVKSWEGFNSDSWRVLHERPWAAPIPLIFHLDTQTTHIYAVGLRVRRT